jgi:hypothetical protein
MFKDALSIFFSIDEIPQRILILKKSGKEKPFRFLGRASKKSNSNS